MQAGKVVQTRIDTWQGDLNPTEYRIWSMLISDEAYGLRPGGNATYVPHRNLEFRILGMTTGVINPTLDTLRSRDERG